MPTDDAELNPLVLYPMRVIDRDYYIRTDGGRNERKSFKRVQQHDEANKNATIHCEYSKERQSEEEAMN